ERAYAQLNQGSEDHVEVAFGAGMQDMGSQPERARRRVHLARLCLRNGRIGRIDQHGHGGRRRDHFMQQLQLLGPISTPSTVTPVRLPPGRLRLAISFISTGSTLVKKTIGIVVVAALAGSAAGVFATITATCRRTKSAANTGSRSY